MFAIVFAADAAIEVTTITAWWRANRLLAPDLFQTELRQALLKVAAHPEIGARARLRGAPSIRTIVLQRTGYVVFYDIDLTASAIEVVRVRHGKRRPLARLKRK
jgi:plasmid stabilization system protein ParE